MKIENDSPRQPVWSKQVPVYASGKHIGTSTISLYSGVADHRRCICGAKPTPDGLPCGH